MNSWAIISIAAVTITVDRLIDGEEMQVLLQKVANEDDIFNLRLNPDMTVDKLLVDLQSKLYKSELLTQQSDTLTLEVSSELLGSTIKVVISKTKSGNFVSHWEWENSESFDTTVLPRLSSYWEKAIQYLTDESTDTLHDFSMFLPEDYAFLNEFNNTKQEWPDGLLIHEQFERNVLNQPDALAVHSSHGTLTYSELNHRAEHVTQVLRKLSITHGDVVALYLDRSLEYVIAMVATAKVGAAFLPLDTVFPVDRVAYILKDADVSCVLTHSELAEKIPETNRKTILIDSLELASNEENKNAVSVQGTDPAYLIYTSGSTGQPKGVELLHAGLANFMNANRREYNLGVNDRMTLLAGTAFDASQFEVWLALTSGSELYIPDFNLRLQPPALVRYLIDHGITFCFLPTPLGERVLLEEWPDEVPLRHLMIGGDRLHPVCKKLPFSVINLYGPSEATVGTTFDILELPMHSTDMPKIGRPFANVNLQVLDRYKRPVPNGIPGELYIGGAGVGSGYYNRQELTEQTFLELSLFGQQAKRFYKTGDRVRLDADGRLNFLGRLDQQIKVRGFRIEIGEIEARLQGVSSIKESAVIALGDQHDKQLVAYVVLSSELNFDERIVRDELLKTLPPYMVPTAFVVVPTLPLTVNGKVDRKALPVLEESTDEKEDLSPTERWLADCWIKVLGSRHIFKSSRFFALGGHSLHAAQVVARIRKTLSIELSLETIFEDLTLEDLSRRLESSERHQSLFTDIVRTTTDTQPLSSSQQRLWFLNQLQPDNTAYNLAGLYEIEGPLDQKNLEQCFQVLIGRHHALRMKFTLEVSEPMQTPNEDYKFSLVTYDLSGAKSNQEEQARTIAEQFVSEPFKLQNDLFLKAALIQLDQERHWLVTVVHHIASDGWSQDLLVEELGILYSEFGGKHSSSLPELYLQYEDYAQWQQSELKSKKIHQQLAYWKNTLYGMPTNFNWKDTRPRPASQTFVGAHRNLILPLGLVQRIVAWCNQERVTLYSTLLSAYCVLLQHYSDQEDFIIGTPVANRHGDTQLESLIGFFVNTMLMPISIKENETFQDLVNSTMETSIKSLAHQDVPFEMLVEELQPERDTSRNPLFQVGFALQNLRNSSLKLKGLQVTKKTIETYSSIVDLTFFVTQHEKELTVEAEFNTDIWDTEMIERMLAQYQMILEKVISKPEYLLSEIPILTIEDHQKLDILNGSPAKHQQEMLTLHQSVEQQAFSNPNAVAVVAGNEALTYWELDQASNHLAAQLQTNGIKRGMPVGICAGRTTWMVVGVLATLRIGAIYVPLDSNYPKDRLADMIEDSSMQIILADESRYKAVSFDPQVQVLILDENLMTKNLDIQAVSVTTSPDDVAYMIYTSGSTGRPKGVCCTHKAVQEMLADMQERQPLTSQDRSSVWTSFSFDVSIYEIFSALTVGAAVYIAPEEVRYQGKQFVEWLVTQSITSAYVPPFMLADLRSLAEINQGAVKLCRLLVGVEGIPEPLLANIAALVPGLVIINGYGPSESTICCTLYTLNPENVKNRNIPIGRPVRNTCVYILDKNQQPVPPGVPGELYVGGAGLSTGYWNNLALTKQKFVEVSIDGSKKIRLYQTGDLVRLLPSGDLDFLGRMDFQVKIRGHRIELGEIENLLKQHSSVQNALVTVYQDPNRGDQLFAYILPELPEAEVQEIRQKLRTRLPAFMMPSAIQSLKTFPLSPNGKINRNLLPVPIWNRLSENVEAPATQLEKKIHQLWKDVLGLADISLDDNFFDIGGHSMLLSRLHLQVQSTLNRQIALLDFFQYPTIRSFIGFLQQEEKEQPKMESSGVTASSRIEALRQQRLRRQQPTQN